LATKTLKEKTASGLFWAAMNNGSMQILNAVIGIFLARLLLPSDYGLIGMLTIFSAIASSLQESGFTSALTNMERPTSNDFNAVFWFSNIVGVSSYIVLFFCAPLIAQYFRHPELIMLSRVLFLCIPLSAVGTVPQAYLYKYMIIKPTTLLRIVSLIIAGAVSVLMAFHGMAYWSLVAMQLIYVGMQSIGKFFLITWKPSLHIDFAPIRKMFGFSSKILVTNIISQISQNILTVIFGRIFPTKTVGNFTQAWKWNSMASNFISGMMAQVAQPVFASLQAEGDRQLKVLRKMVRFTSFLTFPAMLGLALVSKEFIVVLLSEKWLASVPILQILCISGAFLPLYQSLQNLIVSHGRSDLFMWTNIVQILLQIGTILLFAHYGILVMVAAYSAFTALWTLIWHKLTQNLLDYKLLDFLKDTLPFLFAAMAAIAIAYVVAMPVESLLLSLIIKILVAIVIYVTIMKLAKAKIMDECIKYLLHKK
jgi:teichuronic acid exporter